MVLDHFRPQKHFSHLRNEPSNLLYACSKCNLLKSDIWPNLHQENGSSFTDEGEGFIDPFLVDRNEYFQIRDDGIIEELKSPASYMIRILALNREARKLIRAIRIIDSKIIKHLDGIIKEFEENLKTLSLSDDVRKKFTHNLQGLKHHREIILKG